ncbi:hypothetical protein AAE478_004399 [Parahypoxylon ruwenzoriense]
MKSYSLIAFASPIFAAVIQNPALGKGILASPFAKYLNETPSASTDKQQLSDIQVLCGAPPNSPDSDLPAQDYSYPIDLLLDGGGRRLHVDAGPSKCVQAACNAGGGAGVFICNDQHDAINPMYTDIAWFAQRVYEKCKHRKDGVDYVQKGQAFNPDDNWNVILNDVGGDCTASSLPGSG